MLCIMGLAIQESKNYILETKAMFGFATFFPPKIRRGGIY